MQNIFRCTVILFVYLYIIKQIVYEPVKDSLISGAFTVMFRHHREALCCFVFLHIMEKNVEIDVLLQVCVLL